MDMQRTGPGSAYDASYIWLRYSTQFTTSGRTHTIEMNVPVPVGASAEQREQLIREAEAGIEQLYRQIERRATQRNQRSPEIGATQESAAQRSGAGYSQAQQPAQAAMRANAPSTPTGQPARPAPPQQVAAQTPREAPQAIPLQERREATAAPAQTHATIGSEMPVTHNLSNSAPGNIRLAQFIQIIKTNWGLTPKEAMDLLQVKTLNNMNYRDLLRQLEPLVQQRAEAASKNAASLPRPAASPAPVSTGQRVPTPASSTTMRETGARSGASASQQPVPTPPASTNRAPASPLTSTTSPKPPVPSPSLDGPTNIPVFPLRESTLREVPRPYKFDEEEEELEEPDGGREGEDDEDQGGMSDALARIKIDELKEIRGTAPASSGRLTVLHNLLDSQISDTQLQQLIEGLWNINSDKKLKQDHVEALISWAKEDYFEDEVNAVLSVLYEQ